MRLVDVHCHLESKEFEGRLPELLADARKAGIVKLVTASIVPDQWSVSEGLAHQFGEVEFALGVHPWYIKAECEPMLAGLHAARERGAIAIGEIGLDCKIENPALELQRRFFETQLRIAKDIDLPVVVHCRGAFDDLLRSLKTIGAPARGGVVHSYSGSAELAKQLREYGFLFSLGGTLTFRNSKKKIEVLKTIYPDSLLLETDSPDIPPVEKRGEVNVPTNILYNLRAAAEILEEDEERIAQFTTRNAAQLFGLDA